MIINPEYTGIICCELCGNKIKFDERYLYNDLQVCGSCNNILHESKKKKPKHPMEALNEKFEMDEKYLGTQEPILIKKTKKEKNHVKTKN